MSDDNSKKHSGLLLLIIGSSGAGKTTLCRSLVEEAHRLDRPVSGVLSHAQFDGERRVAILAEDLRSGRRELLTTRDDENPTPGSRHWRFDPQVMAWADQVFAESTPTEFLVVDELGPLELNLEQGWQFALEAVDSKQYEVALVVVRSEILGEALLRWPDCHIMEVDTPADSIRKAEYLKTLLF